jgi:hypothetical protein
MATEKTVHPRECFTVEDGQWPELVERFGRLHQNVSARIEVDYSMQPIRLFLIAIKLKRDPIIAAAHLSVEDRFVAAKLPGEFCSKLLGQFHEFHGWAP